MSSSKYALVEALTRLVLDLLDELRALERPDGSGQGEDDGTGSDRRHDDPTHGLSLCG